jgi:V/A-type H+-transporting ATPase subunit I
LALLAGLAAPGAAWLAVIGALWYVGGHAGIDRTHPLRAAGVAAAELVEQGMRLAVNTLSFARVGAFALAHAGLSQAVLSLAEATPSAAGWWVVLVAGNLLIIALEGLVVSIQTTRLILFEFFIRFLRGEGRPFRPVAPPTAPAAG